MQVGVNTVMSLMESVVLKGMNCMESVVDVIRNYANLMQIGVNSVKCLVVIIVINIVVKE